MLLLLLLLLLPPLGGKKKGNETHRQNSRSASSLDGVATPDVAAASSLCEISSSAMAPARKTEITKAAAAPMAQLLNSEKPSGQIKQGPPPHYDDSIKLPNKKKSNRTNNKQRNNRPPPADRIEEICGKKNQQTNQQTSRTRFELFTNETNERERLIGNGGEPKGDQKKRGRRVTKKRNNKKKGETSAGAVRSRSINEATNNRPIRAG